MAEATATRDEAEVRKPLWRAMLRWAGRGLLALLVLLLGLIVFLHTPPGRQLIIDQIAKFAPASGLSVEVGSIEGSVLWSATFNDVQLRDANDVLFLEVPEVDLNWRPYRWFTSGLDIRHLVISDGTLYAAPELIPGDPDAPLLPDFDIRVDHFVIDNLTVAEGLLGEERVIGFNAAIDLRDGRVFADAGGEFGGGDQFTLRVESEPDNNIFDLDLNWQAPAGGFLATMVGAEDDLSIDLHGDGSWSSWEGLLLARQAGADLVNFDIYNEAGQYRLVGNVHPGAYVEGQLARALGEDVAFTASGTLQDSTLQGGFAVRGKALDLDGNGAIDLAENRFINLALEAVLLDPAFFGEGVALEDASLRARLDGPFRELAIPHELSVGRIAAGDIVFSDVVQRGIVSFDGPRIAIPLDMQVGRVVSGNAMVDPRLFSGKLDGTLVYQDNRLTSNDLDIVFRGLTAQLGLAGDLASGRFQLTGPVNARGLEFDGIGSVDAVARIIFAIGGDAPWSLAAQLQGGLGRVDNPTIANIAGDNIRFNGGVSLGEGRPISFNAMKVSGSKLELAVDGSVAGDTTTLAGGGTHADYGPFTIDAVLAGDGPRAQLVLASPLPAAGLKDVHVALAPSDDGFAVETSGASLLGPFDGTIGIALADNGDVSIAITRLDIAESRVTGNLALVEDGVAGTLNMSRGGVNGVVRLAPQAGGQGFDIDLEARNARFGGETPLTLARMSLVARGLYGDNGLAVDGTMSATGVGYGNLFIGRMGATADFADGTGNFDAAITGARGTRFDLQLTGAMSPDRITLAATGSHAGRAIAMPRRAVLDRTADGGWQLQRTQLGYGDGFAILSGRFGGDQPVQGRLSLSDLPLSLVDVLAGDIGLGGTVSGVIDIGSSEGGLPTGQARLMVEGLTRSGLLLTSRPMNLATVISLSPGILQARAVLDDDGGTHGTLAARISGLSPTGSLIPRLYAGDLFAQLRYDGPSAALWRLAAIDLLDVTGEIQLAANVRGTLGNPQVRGSLNGDNLRVQSLLTGTDITQVAASGRFDGSRLQLTSFVGNAPGGGRVSGSGFVDLAGMNRDRGPQIDIRIAARNARILDLPGTSATVTGPLRIVSSGVGGTIAGRLTVNEAEWQLGTTEAAVELPDIAIREINQPADLAPVTRQGRPWRYLIDATANRGIKVDGMGLESEWRGDLLLRGTTSDPRIGGEARIVPRQGFYSFAGVRFEITRGRIDFDETVPPDPRLDLLAETDVNGIDVSVTVQGSASRPEISFNSVPALPEEELLARLLFGGSITDLSATDAVQLGAALASLRGGGGIDPINQLRTAIGLDRLRIVPSDPALDRGTSVALGKNITRRAYVEIITDGQGYNATELEFRITSWLSLLGSISTVGRGGVSAEFSRDY
ncbi:hypothetical protein GCM10009127_28180 [Alteraurantiacibacter aestuarii]|uniref:DUF490 domain-containing protein n=1 Tax=Alteraurantiacibacter aestuarii TaxID=650004 RepID=A0A844ZMD1_9SPHN|nr:translocation/assembly module TamB domain-containing protein [Alteraurantiacibacter aestuarii]MXO88928.1 DUF490 domain-containing protein [Alteraurantiacibacter aestuarii]